MKPTGIILIAFDRQKIHATIEMIQKIVGANIVKPFVDFKKPLADIPRIIAKSKKIYPDRLVISYPVLPSKFTIIIPTIFCIISIVACIFCLSKAMNIIPVGFTYATYGGLTISAVTLFGIFKYNQIPNFYGVIGIILIVIGVILLNTLGRTT